MNKEELTDKIKKMVEELRPYLNMDGGDIEFIKYEDNYLYVENNTLKFFHGFMIFSNIGEEKFYKNEKCDIFAICFTI